MESRKKANVSNSALSRWVAILKKASDESLQDCKKEDEYLSQLYQSILPELLKSGMSFVNCPIPEEMERLVENTQDKPLSAVQWVMIWQFVVAFGLRSGASLDEITAKMLAILKTLNWGQEDQPKLITRIKSNIMVQAHRLVKQYIYAPGDSAERQGWRNISSTEIVRILTINSSLLKFVPLKINGQNLGYQSFDALDEIAEGKQDYYDVDNESLNSEIIGETLYARAVQKQDATLCDNILQIMINAGFKDHEIANILKLPVYLLSQEPTLRDYRCGNPLRDVCFTGDNASLFARVQKYVDKALLEEPGNQSLLVQSAIYYKRIAILRYLQQQLHFDMRALCNDFLKSPELIKINAEIAAFLLDEGGIDKSLLLDAFFGSSDKRGIVGMNNLLARVEKFDYRVVKVIIFLLVEQGVDLLPFEKLYKADKGASGYIGTLMEILGGRSQKLTDELESAAQQAELGDIAYIRGWIAEKFQKQSAVAARYYQEANEYKNFKREKVFIQDRLEELRRLNRANVGFAFAEDNKQKQEAKLFDEIGKCYAQAKEWGAEPKELLSANDVTLLLQVGNKLLPAEPEKISQKPFHAKVTRTLGMFFSLSRNDTSEMDMRKATCSELRKYIAYRQAIIKK